MVLRPLMRSLRGARRFSSAAASATAKPKGPPFARYFWYTTGIMIGIPGVVGGVFVYNLQTDDEFYNHFNDRYPDLIDAINEYVPLNESLLELAKREDIGPIGSTEDLINEKVTVVAELQSRKKVRFEVSGSASQEEIEELALKQSTQPNDRVVAITFAEDGEEEESKSVAPTAQEAWPPAPRVTWGSAAAAQKKSKKSGDSVKELRLQIEEIRAQQASLEESKYAGRDIDEADEEIAALEERKTALKEQLPRKRFLWIF
ncbi:TonB-dependent receptor protein [Phytophthora megakarya]|uniref:TonB-dependent receptor protein n=1 Tax=Phytophthora megakarya TaxID=4795 RepID=A0A225UDP0_9STRA|nr:TonB-dependent receptor protein [Phytophthora megakarya]